MLPNSVICPKCKKPGFLSLRWVRNNHYRPYWHLYIGHYDAQTYKKAMEHYKRGRLKSRPNGRIWHKVRYNRVRGQAQSDLKVLEAKYNFTLMDIMKEIDKKREDFRLKYEKF
jgi:hypothetical protein